MERPDMWILVNGAMYYGPFQSRDYAGAVGRENFERGEPWGVVRLSQAFGNEADDGAPALPNEPNVADYFTAILGRDPSPENVEELNAMPLESACGAECKRAIDAGQAFRESVIAAYGDEASAFYPEKAEQVRTLTEDVCRVFITG